VVVMARQKEFDQEEVLKRAMETFWHYGYEATSVQDLVDNMGINRGSLYDTFGGKRSLFQAALIHYDETIVKEVIAYLEAPEAAKQTIISLFYNLIESAVSDSQRRGCFLTNSAVELCSHDPDTAACINANLQRIENAFKKALVRAQEKGEISLKQDLTAVASFLICSIQGLRVISKVNPDPKVLRQITDVVLSVLE